MKVTLAQRMLNVVLKTYLGFDNVVWEKGRFSMMRRRCIYSPYSWRRANVVTCVMLGMSDDHIKCLNGRSSGRYRKYEIVTTEAIKTYEKRLQEFGVPLWYRRRFKNYGLDWNDNCDDGKQMDESHYERKNEEGLDTIKQINSHNTPEQKCIANVPMVRSSERMFSIFIGKFAVYGFLCCFNFK